MLKKQDIFNSILTSIPFLCLGSIYFSMAIANILFGLAIIFVLVGLSLQKIKFSFSKQNKISYIVVLIPFVLTIISIFNSSNLDEGIKILLRRLPIVFFPIILLWIQIPTKAIKNSLLAYVFMSVVAVLITIFRAVIYWGEGIVFNPDYVFFITPIQHPYFGVYLLIATILTIEYKLIKNKFLWYSVLFIFLIGILLTTSRLVYFGLFLGFIYYFFKVQLSKRVKFSILGLSLIFSIFIWNSFPIKKKIDNTFSYEHSPRLKYWNNAQKVVSEQGNYYFGIGIGDFYSNTQDVYFFKEQEKAQLGINPHSQFVEFYLSNGILGFLMFLFVFIYGFNRVKKQSSYQILMLSIIFLFVCTETILQRKYGVLLYSVWLPFLLNPKIKS